MLNETIRSTSVCAARFTGLAAAALIGLVAGCAVEPAGLAAAAAADGDEPSTSTVTQGIVAGRCADGSQEQVFPGGMVGCAGAVTYANRNALCAPGYRAATAVEWTAMHSGIAPTHNYWTNDDLKYSGGGTSSCAVSVETGFSCGTTPMRVCTAAGTDAEGNVCNWQHCGFNGTAPDQFFGGCGGNVTAGTLCIVGGCADGSIEQTFAGGMVGCAAIETYANRATLCGPGYRVATAAEWVALSNGILPTHNYWTNDALKYDGAGSSSCSVSTTAGNDCGDTPMRVCTPGGTDPEGNVCNWTHCGIDATAPDQSFGGCVGNTFAGALCVPNTGCADGSAEQVFEKGMVGCGGSVAYADRDTLCAPGYQPATAAQWVANRGNTAPTHDYWTDDSLLWNGNSSACFVSTTVGNSCADSPMRVCTPNGADPEGNHCNWMNCGLNTTGPNQFFGGCASNAGTLCAPSSGITAVSGTNVFASHFPVTELHGVHAAGTAGSLAAAAMMGVQGYRGSPPPGSWENMISAACSARTAAGSQWPSHCDPAGIAAAMTAYSTNDWLARSYAATDQASALNEMVASLEFYRSPVLIPIYGQADHWVAVTQVTANNLGGGTWGVSQVKLLDGGPAGQLDSSTNNYQSGLLSFSGTVWANVQYQPVSVINSSCGAGGCSSDPYFQRYALVYDPPRGLSHPLIAAVFTSVAPTEHYTMSTDTASSHVWDSLRAAGVDADPEIWNAIRDGVPGGAFPVNAVWPSGKRWDYYLVPILSSARKAIAFVQLSAEDGSFGAVHVLAKPATFAPVTMTRAEQLARRTLARGERLTAGALTWNPRTDARVARSPSAPYYEFGIVGGDRKAPGRVRVTLDRGTVVRGR